MARPRTVKLTDGDVILSGFTKDRADEIQALLEGPAPTPAPIQSTTPIADQLVAETPSLYLFGDLPHTAIGYHYNEQKKRFEMVEIKYDVATGCKIDKTYDAGEVRGFAINNFKIACDKLGLI